jgi:hypothetical protein
MITILSALVSLLSFRIRSGAFLELELITLRHQVIVLRRQQPARIRLFSTDRLLWVWLYRIWPHALDTMALVKPTTVVQWHRQGFRLYWRWRSLQLGRPEMSTEIRDLIRRECLNHVIIFDERRLRRVLLSYLQYHHQTRTHLSLEKDSPETRPIPANRWQDHCVRGGRWSASSLSTSRRVNTCGGPDTPIPA